MSLTGKFAFLYVHPNRKRFPVDSAVQFQSVLWGSRFVSGKNEIRRMIEKKMPLNNVVLPIEGRGLKILHPNTSTTALVKPFPDASVSTSCTSPASSCPDNRLLFERRSSCGSVGLSESSGEVTERRMRIYAENARRLHHFS
jgi:hypothetical protein